MRCLVYTTAGPDHLRLRVQRAMMPPPSTSQFQVFRAAPQGLRKRWPASVRERCHQAAEAGDGFFDFGHPHRVPDVGLTTGDHRLADLAL